MNRTSRHFAWRWWATGWLVVAACWSPGLSSPPPRFVCARAGDCREGQGCFDGVCTPLADIPPPRGLPARVTPPSGPIGTLVTVSAVDFDVRLVRGLRVASTPAVVTSTSAQALRAVVMPGTRAGPVQLVTEAGVLTTEAMFTVTDSVAPTEENPVVLRPDGGMPSLSFGFGSVAVSADGRTVLAGGINDSTATGAAWVFVFDDDTGRWLQQGPKLVGTGSIGPSRQGWSVALSADGDTAAVGGYYDDTQAGAAWVFVRRDGEWRQQGPKLVGSGAIGTNASQGNAVALSADGDTLLVSGPIDRSADPGSTWVFERTDEAWTQLPGKLAPAHVSLTNAYAGTSAALSLDGRTALLGGFNDGRGIGAAWTFVRGEQQWAESQKLVGADPRGASEQGRAVAFNGDGVMAAVGGPKDGAGRGAVWLFEKRDAGWFAMGSALVGPDSPGAEFGAQVALDASGSVLAVGAPGFDGGDGAVWLYSRVGSEWLMAGSPRAVRGGGANEAHGRAVALSADGTTLVVGAPGVARGTGSVWVWGPRPR